MRMDENERRQNMRVGIDTIVQKHSISGYNVMTEPQKSCSDEMLVPRKDIFHKDNEENLYADGIRR